MDNVAEQLAGMNLDDEFKPTGHWTREALQRLKHLVTEETLTWLVIEDKMKEFTWERGDGVERAYALATLQTKCREKGWRKKYASPDKYKGLFKNSPMKAEEVEEPPAEEVKEEDFAALNTQMRAELQATKKALAMLMAHVRKYQDKCTSLSGDDVHYFEELVDIYTEEKVIEAFGGEYIEWKKANSMPA